MVLLAACGHLEVRNTTPSTMATNAAEVYPISMRLDGHSGEVIRESVKARVVVDGKVRPMRRTGGNEFLYEHALPRERSSTSYYFDVDYLQKSDVGNRKKNIKTDIYGLRLCNRYVLGLDSTRGIPGTQITVIGRGFAKDDEVLVGSLTAETRFESPTALCFFVPILPANTVYELSVVDDTGRIPAGKFRIDAGSLSAAPMNLDFRSGEKAKLVLSLPIPAPEGGVPVDITTNIPDAISVDEVQIPAGKNSVTLHLEGLEPAEGSLFIAVDGFRTLRLPLHVNP
ncbi:MAG: hypothetical protein LBS68_01570 [Puniceicoccales bacterium]|nr:hypothetical protein [Puniceicoccales bacterium]